jgi:tight adherence protein C
MSPLSLAAAVLVVAGVALLVSSAPHRHQPRLADRLEPYLRGLRSRRTSLLDTQPQPLTPFPTLERLLRPILHEGGRLVERWIGGSVSVARRLREAGKDTTTVAQFRAEQVLWGLIGFAVAVASTLLLPGLLGRSIQPLALLGGVALGVLGGVLGRDWWLTQEVERRHARILSEFPTLADLLCLAVTAGEAPRAAIQRLVDRAQGEMSRELGLVLAELRVGVPFPTALQHLAVRVPIPQIVRFVDGLVVAMDRGTPLADILRAQAADVREQRKRQIIEIGGKKEVYMMVPVVFLILPVVVLFALYPGYFSLRLIAR